MRWSKSLIPTMRQTPAEAVVPSHQLMLRAGLVRQVAAGSYAYLPLGWRVLHKVMGIIRAEMDAAGAVECFMPTLQPIELWERTGRREAYGDNLFVVRDRHGRDQAMGPTHEEVFTEIVKQSVDSYRDLPLTIYQIQTKFRDEFRPRFGVLRSREFQMKDAYSFDLTAEGLDASYDAMYEAYKKIFERCGLRYVIVEAEAGPIGGNASHEFMIPSPTGEDTILSSDKDNYAANVEKCETGERPHDLLGEPTGELEKVHTPGMATIEDVGKFMKVKPKNMLKTLVFRAIPTDEMTEMVSEDGGPSGCFMAVVRGDHEVNEAKLLQRVIETLPTRGWRIELISDTDAKTRQFPIGFVGPHLAAGHEHIGPIIVDLDAAQPGFWASGANEVDHHIKHFNWQRDVIEPLGEESHRVKVADIRNAIDGDPSPKNDGGVLREAKGIEVGHVFKLGCKYSTALDLKVQDENQQDVDVIMGCYGIGVNRIIAAAIEADEGHDDRGVIWSMPIAPFHVVITPIKYAPGGAAGETADKLYAELTARGIDVLLDDRDERPGVKFNDADLIGIPLRITIGDKGLANGEVELKARTAEKPDMVKVDDVVERVVAIVNA